MWIFLFTGNPPTISDIIPKCHPFPSPSRSNTEISKNSVERNPPPSISSKGKSPANKGKAHSFATSREKVSSSSSLPTSSSQPFTTEEKTPSSSLASTSSGMKTVSSSGNKGKLPPVSAHTKKATPLLNNFWQWPWQSSGTSEKWKSHMRRDSSYVPSTYSWNKDPNIKAQGFSSQGRSHSNWTASKGHNTMTCLLRWSP